MAHPSASAHRSKDWESFQYDIQKKTVNLPRGEVTCSLLSPHPTVGDSLSSVLPFLYICICGLIIFALCCFQCGNREGARLFAEFAPGDGM